MRLHTQVQITGTSIVGTLVHKGFSVGNFMYTVQTADKNGIEFIRYNQSNGWYTN